MRIITVWRRRRRRRPTPPHVCLSMTNRHRTMHVCVRRMMGRYRSCRTSSRNFVRIFPNGIVIFGTMEPIQRRCKFGRNVCVKSLGTIIFVPLRPTHPRRDPPPNRLRHRVAPQQSPPRGVRRTLPRRYVQIASYATTCRRSRLSCICSVACVSWYTYLRILTLFFLSYFLFFLCFSPAVTDTKSDSRSYSISDQTVSAFVSLLEEEKTNQKK